MNARTIVASILIVLGIAAFVYQAVEFTTGGRDVEIASPRPDGEPEHHFPLPPILGVIALVAGVVMLLSDRRGMGRPATR